jgi:prolyl-tRNA editing enzyme YbaK/EbsC (Cys-tRNA(Pro) deacylase)
MKFGDLTFAPATAHLQLLAQPVADAVPGNAFAVAIDPTLADTATFCEHYHIGLDVSANCVVVEAKRGDHTWYAACMVLATGRVDVNGVVRKHLNARKISFAPMQTATGLTGMEYGGITPIGLPADWPILVDEAVTKQPHVIIGSGRRDSKILIAGAALGDLPNAVVMPITK